MGKDPNYSLLRLLPLSSESLLGPAGAGSASGKARVSTQRSWKQDFSSRHLGMSPEDQPKVAFYPSTRKHLELGQAGVKQRRGCCTPSVPGVVGCCPLCSGAMGLIGKSFLLGLKRPN